MHYILVTHEVDIILDDILKIFHSKALPVDKEFMRSNNLCECINYTFPVIRELRFFEIDVLDPCAKAFEDLLKEVGIKSMKKVGIIKFIFNWLIGKIFGKKKEKFDFIELEDVKSRMNSRSMIILRKPDERWKEENEFKICPRCNKRYPTAWL
jgi:hypothetical protein